MRYKRGLLLDQPRRRRRRRSRRWGKREIGGRKHVTHQTALDLSLVLNLTTKKKKKKR